MAPEDPRPDAPEVIEAPAPTPWAFVTAAGVTLGFAGVVTYPR
jgi:hypothetical protein